MSALHQNVASERFDIVPQYNLRGWVGVPAASSMHRGLYPTAIRAAKCQKETSVLGEILEVEC